MGTNQAGSANQASEQRYRHLFEHVPICIFVIDLTVSPATILEVNRRAELVYGYSATELVGMPVIHLVPKESKSLILSIVQQVQQGQRVKVETMGRRRDGTRFSVRVIATRDPANDGHMIITVEDMTAEKQRRTEAEAIDAERRRIAREIHDGVAQNLAGLRFKLALWSHDDSASPDIRAALNEFQTVLTDAIVDLRRSIFALRPIALETVGFFPALTQLVGDFGEQNQLVIQMEVTGTQYALPPAYELSIFRILQEGLNNISQHALASLVLVRLLVDVAGGILVSVRDNGCGFDPRHLVSAHYSGQFGLCQMRERIIELGGTLDIYSILGKGTELLITLPPPSQDSNDAPD